MPAKTLRSKAFVATILTAIVVLAFPVNINASPSSTSRKLEENPIKCTSCFQNPPPPSPPPPSISCSPPPPPPPSLSCSPPPPPPPLPPVCQSPPCTLCITGCITGPPGGLYPVDMLFGAAAGKSLTVMKISGLIAFGVLGFLMNIN